MTAPGVTVAERLAEVRRRIERAGGGPDVAVLAVTKGFGPEAIAAAMDAGCPAVGENYAQELLAKLGALDALDGPPDRDPRSTSSAGSSRARSATLAGVVDVWQSIDRPVLVDEVARRAPGARIMVQVNVSDEPQKGGCAPGEAPALVDRGRATPVSTSTGLMTVGRTGPPDGSRAGFRGAAPPGRRGSGSATARWG